MDAKNDFIEPLLRRAEAYGKTSLKLLRLKAVEKTAVVTASLLTRLLLIAATSFSLIAINVGVALWLGELLGKSYYGFLLVGACYAFFTFLLLLLQPKLKRRIANFIITQLLN